MIDLAATIEAMEGEGFDAPMIVRALKCVRQREAVVVDQAAERRRAKDRERKRLRNSAEVGGNNDAEAPPLEEKAQTQKEDTPPPSTHKETPLRGSKKGSRLPDDFAPDLEWATGHGLSPSQAEAEAAKFADHWRAKSGRDATKLDWDATWRNWVRNAKGWQSRAGPTVVPLKDTVANAARRRLEAIENGERRQGTPDDHQQVAGLIPDYAGRAG